MKRMFLFIVLFSVVHPVVAGQVEIVHANFKKQGSKWHVEVTLKHNDTGWEHYADAWRIVLPTGKVVGTRTLSHPHINEQPFTRSLMVTIPENIKKVSIEARDNVHGWSKQRVDVDLTKASGARYKVTQ